MGSPPNLIALGLIRKSTGVDISFFQWMLLMLPLLVAMGGVLFGVLYLNRNDVAWLPAGGVIWMPSDSRRYELLFPKPKLDHRIMVGADFERGLARLKTAAEAASNVNAHAANAVL